MKSAVVRQLETDKDKSQVKYGAMIRALKQHKCTISTVHYAGCFGGVSWLLARLKQEGM